MVIDFHTHTFPDSIAEKAVAHLSRVGHTAAFTDAKRDTLVQSMKENHIDISVVLPVATAPTQVSGINALSAKINGRDGVCYAGAVHPDCGNIDETLDFIKANGLFGIKLHPDYQGVHFDDVRYLRIMEAAAKRGLYIITHAGIDIAYRDHVHCTPDMVLHALDALGGIIDNKLILAHMGGYELPDEVLEKLCGKPVLMDTAAVLDLYPEKCAEIIRSHGAKRVLFATDSPWRSQKQFVELLCSLPLKEEEKENILHKNAESILFAN